MEILFIAFGATVIGTFIMARWRHNQSLRFAQLASLPSSRVAERPSRQ